MVNLKNHPYAVEAFFNKSIVLTFAFEKQELEAKIPDCLKLDLFQDKWAFVAVAVVDTSALRPAGFPNFLGRDFILVGYRVFVQFTNQNGKRLRGLYILKSETNKKLMTLFGNIFTHYNYSTSDIAIQIKEDQLEVKSMRSNFAFTIATSGETNLPIGSPFDSLKEARRFAGPLPFTFTYNESKNEILIIEGVRTNWKPLPIQVKDFYVPFISAISNASPILANSFMVTNIPYKWRKGKIEKWNR